MEKKEVNFDNELTLETAGEANPFVRRDRKYLDRYENDALFRWRIRIQFVLLGIPRMIIVFGSLGIWFIVYNIICLVTRTKPKEFQYKNRTFQKKLHISHIGSLPILFTFLATESKSLVI